MFFQGANRDDPDTLSRSVRPRSLAVPLLCFLLCVPSLHVILTGARLIAAAPAVRQSLEFVGQLQQLQLHRLAEVYCRQQLERTPDAAADQAPIVVELLKSLTGRALESRDLNDVALWVEADAIADRYQREFGHSLEGGQIGLHRQWVRLARADWRLAAADLDPKRDVHRQQALDLLRESSRSLQQLEGQIEGLLRSSSTRRDVNVSRALQRLRQQIAFVAGRVFLRRADAYAARSADRIHLLTEALQEFEPLARITPSSELSWQSRFREIESLRRLRNFDVARERLKQCEADAVPDRLSTALVVEQARLDIDEGNARAAADRLNACRQRKEVAQAARQDDPIRSGAARPLLSNDVDAPANDAELMLTLVEAYVELAKQQGASSDTQPSRRWQALALGIVRQMEEDVSTYWVRRAEAILSVRPHDSANASDLEIMSRTAANFYRRRQFSDALVEYQRASQLAHKLGLSQQAFTFGLRAAAVQQQLGHSKEAVAAFARIAKQYPNHRQATQAHWLAITCAAKRVRQDAEFVDAYETLLDEHLRKWPSSPWSDDVRFWLGQLKSRQSNAKVATELWRGIHPESPRFPATVALLRRTYHQRLAQIAASDERRSLAIDAATQFTSWRDVLLDLSDEPTEAAWDVALSAAEFSLFYQLSTAEFSWRLVQAVGDDRLCTNQIPNRAHAFQGLVHALARRADHANRHWDAVDWSEYELAVPLVARLHDALQSSGETIADDAPLASLLWQLVQKLHATERWRDNQQLRAWGALAQARVGQRHEAIATLQQLAQQSPRNPLFPRHIAELCETGEADEDQRQAVDHWRLVVRLTPPQSEAWFQAKLGIARGLIRSKQQQRAVELIRLLQTLHPTLGGPGLKKQFDRLLQQADR